MTFRENERSSHAGHAPPAASTPPIQVCARHCLAVGPAGRRARSASPHCVPGRLRCRAQEEGARKYLPGNPVAFPSASLQEILAHPDIIPTHHHPLLGRQAPDFELADPEGKVWSLAELSDGRPLVLIFHYGHHCVACARQLFEVNRDLPLFREVGAQVAAISPDPAELTWQRFGFPVLSDPGNKTARAYDVFRGDQLRHGTFLIDGKGTVQWVNVGDAPFRRNSALLYELARMGGTSAVRKVVACVTAAMGLACVSCAKDSIYPVSGKVMYMGAPASGAVVFFHRHGGDPSTEPAIMAIVGEDGSFELVCGAQGKGSASRRIRCADRMETSRGSEQGPTATRPGQTEGPLRRSEKSSSSSDRQGGSRMSWSRLYSRISGSAIVTRPPQTRPADAG